MYCIYSIYLYIYICLYVFIYLHTCCIMCFLLTLEICWIEFVHSFRWFDVSMIFSDNHFGWTNWTMWCLYLEIICKEYQYIYTHTYIYIYSAGILIEEMNVNQFIMERFIGIVLGLLWYCGFRYKNHPEFAMGLSTKLIGIIRRPGIYETVCKRWD